MFDFAWSEIVLIGVVALIAIGPKDMPAALKAVAGVVKKARRMAGEFQTHVDEMMREADLHEVRQQINEIRNFDIGGEVERTVDADGSLRSTFNSNPLDEPHKPAVTPAPGMAAAGIGTASVDMPKNFTLERPADPVEASDCAAPDFVPPGAAPEPAPAAAEAEEAPDFLPPGTHRA